MAKTSFVLRALSLLGLEEILKLTEHISERRAAIKKAAGEDLIVWDDSPSKKKHLEEPPKEAKVLDFPKSKSIHDFKELEDPAQKHASESGAENGNSKEEPVPSLIASEMVLWQREIGKETGGALKKVDAFKGYQKSTQMYVVKTETPEGKQKIRFASTDGILVNKKQA